MKILSFLLIITISCFTFSQEEITVDSKVIAATVFKNRALITREAERYLSAGRHTLVFSNLSTDLQNESVRVSAEGNSVIKILDVKVEQRFTTETLQENIKIIERKIDSLNQMKQVTFDEIVVYESKKEFVESLKVQSSKYLTEKMLLNANSTKEWNEMLRYVEDNLKDIYKGLREQNRKRTFIEQQINALQMELNESLGKKTKNYKEVIVEIEIKNSGNVLLNPSYIVQSANWYPLYDARLISASKEVELSYYGMVNQNTGEDWKDIVLSLSTSEPMSVKTIPELERWFIDITPLPLKQNVVQRLDGMVSNFNVSYEQNWSITAGHGSITGYVIDNNSRQPLNGANIIVTGTSKGSATDANGKFLIQNVPAGQYNIAVSYIGYQRAMTNLNILEKNIAHLNIPLIPAPVQYQEVSVTAQVQSNQISIRGGSSTDAPQEIQYSNVYAKELSTSFEIQTKNSIPSDNSQHKVTIAVDKLPVEYSYTSVPKINPVVYLKGKAVNSYDYPFLAGEINIFFDNDFVSRSYLNNIVPTDTLALALGTDDKIQIKKVLINKYQELKGILGGSRQITYDYEIQITNNRTTEESIIIYDQIPIAMNEDITVELLEPKKSEKELGNDKKLEWNAKLKPGEKRIIPLKYLVKFPNNNTVYNLE